MLSTPPQEGYPHKLFLLEELKQFVGGGKKKRKGQEHRHCGPHPTLEFRLGTFSTLQSLPHCGSRPGVHWGPFLLEFTPGSLNLASPWLPAPSSLLP